LFAGLSEDDLKDLPVLFRPEEYERGERIITRANAAARSTSSIKAALDILKLVVSREGECQEKNRLAAPGRHFRGKWN